MPYKILLAVLLFIIGFNGCSAPKIFVDSKKSENAGRLLSYKQADVADPFIDSLLTQPLDSATIKTVLLPPPPPPPPAFKQIEGHRVQVFASQDSISALTEKMKVKKVVSDSVYLVKENGFYKIQIGDYRFYPQADSVRRYLAKDYYPKAWIPKCMIYVPNIIERDSSATANETSLTTEPATHRIQVFVTTDEAKALQIVQELQKKFSYANYQRVDGRFKIFVGRFSSRGEAQKILEQLKRSGYRDAFLAPVN